MRKIFLGVIITTFLVYYNTEQKQDKTKADEDTAGVTTNDKKPASGLLDLSADGTYNVNHFNDAGKVDFIDQYIDRHQIMKATKGMK